MVSLFFATFIFGNQPYKCLHPMVDQVTQMDAGSSPTGVISHGAVRSAASSYAAMHMVAGSRPVLVIA